jgi:hypothetical protein
MQLGQFGRVALETTPGAGFGDCMVGNVAAWTIHALIIAQEMDAGKRIRSFGSFLRVL